MSKKEHSDKLILFFILLGFSASMVILVGTTHSAQRNELFQSTLNNTTQVSTQRLIEELSPLLQAHAIDQLAQQVIYFNQFSSHVLDSLTEYVLDGSSSDRAMLSPRERAEFLVALAYYYTSQEKVPNVGAFFNWLMKYEPLFEQHPFLYVVVAGPYKGLLKRVKKSSFNTKEHIFKAFKQAITAGNVDSMQYLINAGFYITAQDASELLYFAAGKADVEAFIPLLLSQGAVVDSVHNGNTALIVAVEKGNKATVKALLKAGANPLKASTDKAIGTPLDIAFKNNYVTIERMLRAAIMAQKAEKRVA